MALWCTGAAAAGAHAQGWRNRAIEGEHPYVYLDGIVLKRSWAGEVRNVSLLVAIGVNSEGYREILGICEGAKEDKAGSSAFLKHLRERGLAGIRLIISGACLGLSESAAEFFPEAAWQRCIVGSLKKLESADSLLVDDSTRSTRYDWTNERR
jgi:transposase-like protein